jgi:acyl-CoA synthetase (NDP forming)
MARARTPGAPELPPPTRGPEGTQLGALLRARRFRLGAGAERVAHNLRLHGGEIAGDAAAWIGATRPPPDAPSVSLGEAPGTLGPRSFGFVNLVGGVAALDAPLPALPRRGGLALVVPARDALPDVGPLALARALGLSWIVSVGDGDPAEALAFLGADPLTTSLAVVLGAGARGATLRQVLGVKPTVVWGGDALCRAVVRRAGALAVDGIDAWLARAALLDAGVEPGGEVEVVVIGGGRAFVEDEVRAAALSAPVTAVDERTPEALAAAVAAAAAAGRAVVLVAGGPPSLPEAPSALRLLTADLRHPEHLRALLAALALPPVDAGEGTPRARVDRELAAKVRAEVDTALSDHDAKRLLKAWGARVTRQAPTGTPTGAVKLARQIGLPVLLEVDGDQRRVETFPEVRRMAALLLQASRAPTPSVMVRESFPDAPRARARVGWEKGLGLVLRIVEREACALLPLTRADAQALSAATAARRAADQRAVAELLGRIAACAEAEQATLDLELFVGAEPAVLRASGELRR